MLLIALTVIYKAILKNVVDDDTVDDDNNEMMVKMMIMVKMTR